MSTPIPLSLGQNLANTFKTVAGFTTLPTNADDLRLIADAVEKDPFKALDIFNGSHIVGPQAHCMANHILQFTTEIPAPLRSAFDMSFLFTPASETNDADTVYPSVVLRHGGTVMLGEMCKGIAEIIREAADAVH